MAVVISDAQITAFEDQIETGWIWCDTERAKPAPDWVQLEKVTRQNTECSNYLNTCRENSDYEQKLKDQIVDLKAQRNALDPQSPTYQADYDALTVQIKALSTQQFTAFCYASASLNGIEIALHNLSALLT